MRRRIADEALGDSLRANTTDIGIVNRTIVSEKPRAQASHW